MKNYTLLILKILLLSALFSGNAFSQGQTTTQGKDFWVSFGVNSADPILQVRIVASKNTTVTFTFTESGTSYSFNVAAGVVYTKELTLAEKASVYNSATSGINFKSLKIQATENISVFAINLAQHTTDATNVLPITNYGTSYYHTSYAPVDGAGDGYTIIANEDGTTVSENGVHLATLNKGNVYVKYMGVTDLTGVNITSNKPVAYFVTNSCVFVPTTHYACDCLFQQMIPTVSWGNHFLVPVTIRGRERVRIVASQNGTVITQTGGIVQSSPGTGTLTLNAGQFVELEATLAANGCYINSNKPVAVASYLAGLNYITANGGPNSGDPALAIIPPIEQLVSRVAIAPFIATGSSVLTEHHALIMTPTATKNLTTMGIGAGAPTALTGGTWYDHSSGYSFYNIPLTNGLATYFFENPNGLTVMGYGLGDYESYYYLAAASARQLSPAFYINDIHYQDLDGQVFCDQDMHFRAAAQFDLRPTDFVRWYIDGVEKVSVRDQMTWTLPEHSLTLDVPHTYRMDIYSSTNDLYSLSTTFTLIDPQPPVITPTGPVNICAPATGITLSTSPGASWYQWYRDGVLIIGATTNTYFATVTGSYTVEARYASCNPGPSSPVVVSIGTSATPELITTIGDTVCSGDTATLSASSTGVTNPVYKWYDSQSSVTPLATGSRYTTPSLTTTTTYYVSVTGDNYCENQINQRKAVIATVGNNLIPGVISGSKGVCASNPYPGPLGGPASTGGSGPYTYQWQESSDSINWTNISGATGLNYDPGALSASRYYRRLTTDPRCGTVPSNNLFVSYSPDQMYWNISSDNSNWNDPGNWADIAGRLLNAVPLSCTNVHIPGNAYYYPSLDSATTIRNAYFGDPVCDDIIFHFGAEVAKPHYLSYNKAYILYNFGYYDSDNAYKIDGDVFSAYPIKRNQWYALAAPLKKVVSGDFSVGGFPNTWQQGFHTTPEHSGDLVGEWYTPENTVALEVGVKQNYAISIWVAKYTPEVQGEDDHQNLNSMRGILEIPYFDKPAISSLHRIHSRSNGQCKFNYYWDTKPGMPVESSRFDVITRGDESYRFVIEDSNNKPQRDFKLTVPADKEVLIGNVFLSTLDFRDFYSYNSSKIEEYYRLFENNTWKSYSISQNPNNWGIASFQSFVLKTKGIPGQTVDLYFPISSSVTRTNSTPHQLRSTKAEQFFPKNVLCLKASNNEGETRALVAVNTAYANNINVPQMFTKDLQYKELPQIYTLDRDSKKNTIQYEFGNQIETPFGIMSDTASVVELEALNVENMKAKSLILYDKKRNKSIDLYKQSSYKFTHDPTDGVRFELRIDKPSNPTGIENAESDNTNVYTVDKTLYVTSSKEIQEVSLMSIQGSIILTENPGLTDYSKELSVSTGVYAVKVKLADGEVKIVKVVVK